MNPRPKSKGCNVKKRGEEISYMDFMLLLGNAI
jgi:hypothetical protein